MRARGSCRRRLSFRVLTPALRGSSFRQPDLYGATGRKLTVSYSRKGTACFFRRAFCLASCLFAHAAIKGLVACGFSFIALRRAYSGIAQNTSISCPVSQVGIDRPANQSFICWGVTPNHAASFRLRPVVYSGRKSPDGLGFQGQCFLDIGLLDYSWANHQVNVVRMCMI
jgi:hypothetical protein